MKKSYTPVIALIIIILVISTVFVTKHFYGKSVKYKDFEISQLTEQLKIAREDLYKKPPPPSPQPQINSIAVIDKSSISNKNTYPLTCWHGSSAPNSPLSKTLAENMYSNEVIHDICMNNELQKAVMIINSSGMILKTYDLKTKELKTMTDQIRGGGGICEIHIYLWSRDNNLYYKLIGCDGPPVKPFLDYLYKVELPKTQ